MQGNADRNVLESQGLDMSTLGKICSVYCATGADGGNVDVKHKGALWET